MAGPGVGGSGIGMGSSGPGTGSGSGSGDGSKCLTFLIITLSVLYMIYTRRADLCARISRRPPHIIHPSAAAGLATLTTPRLAPRIGFQFRWG